MFKLPKFIRRLFKDELTILLEDGDPSFFKKFQQKVKMKKDDVLDNIPNLVAIALLYGRYNNGLYEILQVARKTFAYSWQNGNLREKIIEKAKSIANKIPAEILIDILRCKENEDALDLILGINSQLCYEAVFDNPEQNESDRWSCYYCISKIPAVDYVLLKKDVQVLKKMTVYHLRPRDIGRFLSFVVANGDIEWIESLHNKELLNFSNYPEILNHITWENHTILDEMFELGIKFVTWKHIKEAASLKDSLVLSYIMQQEGFDISKPEYNDILVYSSSNVRDYLVPEYLSPDHSKALLHPKISNEGLEALLELGANSNIQDKEGNTPAHFNVKKNQQRIKILHKYKADFDIKNKEGFSARDLYFEDCDLEEIEVMKIMTEKKKETALAAAKNVVDNVINLFQ